MSDAVVGVVLALVFEKQLMDITLQPHQRAFRNAQKDKLLKRLETAGHIVRTRDAADERRVRLTLTKQGRSLRAKAVEIPAQIACEMGLPLETLVQLKQTLTSLAAD